MPRDREVSGEKRFAVLDRDGTIIVDHPYSSDPTQIELIPGAERGLRQLRDLGLGLVVITNQSGIGRGFFGKAALDLMHQALRELLEAAGIRLDGIYACPHRPEDGCDCRKPEPALLELAAQELDFDPGAAFVIGDKASDIALGRRLGATTFLVGSGVDSSPAADPPAVPDYAVDDLAAAAKVIGSLLHAEGTAPRPPNRTLVMMLGGIGNLVLLMPALKAMRAQCPESQVVLLTGEPGIERILDNEDVVDDVMLLDRRKGGSIADTVRIIKKIRKTGFDRVLVASSTNALKASLLSWLMGIPVRIGEDIQGMGWFYTVKVPFTAGTHETDGAIDLIRAAGVEPLSTVPSLTILDDEAAYVDRYLSERGVGEGSRLMGVHSGSGFKGLHKRWPKERFAQLIKQVTAKIPARVVLVGGRQEAALNEEILTLSGSNAINTAGDLEIRHTAALIKRCRLFVSNDSGLAHIAAAAQTKLIVLFGETNPHRIAPRGANVVLLRGVPTGADPHRSALLNITVEDVRRAVMNAMNDD